MELGARRLRPEDFKRAQSIITYNGATIYVASNCDAPLPYRFVGRRCPLVGGENDTFRVLGAERDCERRGEDDSVLS